ncbi:aminotransferase class I/II-fold pyridoxal phosphate-dependent enzyme [Salinisphaera sp. USBA-960]|uniref:serine palmitoyltransferase n=1 Tax=Salinisphaera orenii TaxID=856731 RepID=UPI000DBE4E26|nr:aminotransferase class I/II-fold pyridoxal phosphate-dependent enzyme [Salifodinibacter halophilus]NNC26745.1 aminotransferase class I/II-fold pyridoxal phosphate-dependent enzyme [Salifodinibacter halophilus]
MSLFEKFESLAEQRRELDSAGVDPLGVPMERMLSATEAMIDGRRTILAGSNNYLGLTFDPTCIHAAAMATRFEGTGTTGSRMANGSYNGHLQLESELAEFYGMARGMVFSTGYQANLGTLSALCQPGDVLMLDADCHASIFDGAKLSGADVICFRHNDPTDLGKRLRRLGERVSRTLVVVEGIYSMLGDQAPLADLVSVARDYGAYILVDEAHSLGIAGVTGCGIAESQGVQHQADFIVGTFSKSLGATGGFCVSPHESLDYLRYTSRPYIFTASPPPAVIASVRTALADIRSRPDRRRALWQSAERLHAALASQGYQLGAPPGPVVAAMFADRERALACWQALLDNGVYVNLMLPPATPGGHTLIRISLSAAHTRAQINHIIAVFSQLQDEFAQPG